LERIDYIANGIQNFDNDDERVDDRDREPDAGGGLGDFGGAAGFKLKAQSLKKGNDGTPSIDKTLNQIPDLCYRAFNINDSRLKPKIFAEVLERLNLALEGIEQVDASVEHACKVLDELLTEIEKLLKSRKFFEKEIEEIFNPQAGDRPVK
jgi:hypothetical protein